jgi:predicted metallopeptidase
VDEQQARRKFKCDDCEKYPGECLGIGKMSQAKLKGLSLDEKATVVLTELAQIPKADGRGRSGLRRLVKAHFGELEEALAAGNTYKVIAQELTAAGVKVSGNTLSHHYTALKREMAGKQGSR